MPNRFRPGDQCDADSQWWVWSSNALLCTITLLRDRLPFAFPVISTTLPLVFFFYSKPAIGFALWKFCTDHRCLEVTLSIKFSLAVGLHINSGEKMPKQFSPLMFTFTSCTWKESFHTVQTSIQCKENLLLCHTDCIMATISVMYQSLFFVHINTTLLQSLARNIETYCTGLFM